MKANKYILIFVLLLYNYSASSSDTLTLESYLDIISENYPLIKKAELYNEFAAAYQTKGEGSFDPKINSSWQSKDFSDINYFNIWQTELKVPTRLPIDLSVGYENNEGAFLNAENNTPQSGLFYGTLNISVVRGLMFDEQRYNLQAAELYGIKSQVERDILTREILYQAVNTYIEWSAAQEMYNTLESFLTAVQERHTNVVQLYINGDKPAIDTVESRISLNTALKNKLVAYNKLLIKRQKVAVFLWDESGRPLVFKNHVLPESMSSTITVVDQLSSIEDIIFERDPSIRKLENQQDLLRVKNKLERENLKPQLDLKYNTIVNLGKEGFDPSFSINDYKYGITVEVPIANRKTKGNIALNEALINQNDYDQSQYKQKLITRYEALLLSKSVQIDVIDVVTEKISFSESLYEAETIKFELGESSVFMLNQRERKLLESRMDQIKGYLQYGQTLSELYYMRLGQREI